MSTPERPRSREQDPYWSEDIGLFEGTFRYTRGEPRIVRARVHRSEEDYTRYDHEQEIVPVTMPHGRRTYLHLQPYLAFPDIRLTVGLSAAPRPGGAIGAVTGVEEVGTRQQPIGNGQAWYYPADRLLVLWECFFNVPFRDAPPMADGNMRRLWLGVEDYLTTRFPAATQITTPFRDPLFPDAEYQTFLRSLDYKPVAKAAWGKHIP